MVIGDLHQQRGQAPGLHQRLLQISQRDAQHRLLSLGRAQALLLALQVGDALRQPGRMRPQQQLGKVMQQCGLVDQAGVVVLPVHRKAQRKLRRAVAALQHAAQAVQGLRLAGQPGFDHRLAPEGPEEGRDAQHHQGLGGGLGIGLVAAGAQRGQVAQQLQRHQRVG